MDGRIAGQTRYFIPSLGAAYERLNEFGWALLRIVYGAFYIPRGMQKLFGIWGGNIEGLAKTIEDKVGWSPGIFWAYTIGSLEFFGGILLVLGLFTRPVAFGFVIFMYVAAFHYNNQFGWWWTKGGMEDAFAAAGDSARTPDSRERRLLARSQDRSRVLDPKTQSAQRGRRCSRLAVPPPIAAM